MRVMLDKVFFLTLFFLLTFVLWLARGYSREQTAQLVIDELEKKGIKI